MVIGLRVPRDRCALDRRKLRGAATPFVAVGASRRSSARSCSAATRARCSPDSSRSARGQSSGSSAAHGDQRRGTTWIGVLTVFGGFVAILVDIAPSSAGATGGDRARVRARARLPRVVPRAGARRAQRRQRRAGAAADPGSDDDTVRRRDDVHRHSGADRSPTPRRHDRRIGDQRLPPSFGVANPSSRDGLRRQSSQVSVGTSSAISSPASVGFMPTAAPASRSASIFAAAVPLPPDTIAPACPIFLPGGAVTPAT